MQSSHRLVHEQVTLEFSVIRSHKRRKTLSICINNARAVEVRVPVHTPYAQIVALLQQRWQWINTKIATIATGGTATRLQPWYLRAELFYLGVPYKVHFENLPLRKKRALCEFTGNNFLLTLSQMLSESEREAVIYQTLSAWYRTRAKSYLVARTQFYAEQMQLQPQQIIIKTQKCRWGSCDARNNIRYNWKVIMALPELIDYLVVHELAHIKCKNHGRQFWSLVASILPEHRNLRRRLHEFGQMLGQDK